MIFKILQTLTFNNFWVKTLRISIQRKLHVSCGNTSCRTLPWHNSTSASLWQSWLHPNCNTHSTPLPTGQRHVVLVSQYQQPSSKSTNKFAAIGYGYYDGRTRPPSTGHGVCGEVWPTKPHGLHPTETRLSWQNSWCGHFEFQQACRKTVLKQNQIKVIFGKKLSAIYKSLLNFPKPQTPTVFRKYVIIFFVRQKRNISRATCNVG